MTANKNQAHRSIQSKNILGAMNYSPAEGRDFARRVKEVHDAMGKEFETRTHLRVEP